MKRRLVLLGCFLAAAALSGCGGGGGEGGGSGDTTAPAVIGTSPKVNAASVAEDTLVTATFSEALDLAQPSGALLLQDDSGLNEPGTLSFDRSTLTVTFTSDSLLKPDTRYTAVIAAWVADLAGNPLPGEYRWSFVTGPAPTVAGNFPAAGASGVGVEADIRVTFSEAVDPATLAIRLERQFDNSPVAGRLDYDAAAHTAIFTPTESLLVDTTYLVTVEPAVTDLAGNPLQDAYTWQFVTLPPNPPQPPPF